MKQRSAAMVFAALTMCGCLPVLTGCSGSEPTSSTGAMVGQTVSDIEKTASSPVVYDFSTPILGVASRFNSNAEPSAWVVVAACYQPNNQGQPSIGVIPSRLSTTSILSKARAGKFQHLLSHCTRR